MDFLPSELNHISLDTTNKKDCQEKLKKLNDVSHVFFVAWVNSATEEERCKVNKEIVSVSRIHFNVFIFTHLVNCIHSYFLLDLDIQHLRKPPRQVETCCSSNWDKNYLGPFEVIAERFKETDSSIVDELPMPFKVSDINQYLVHNQFEIFRYKIH